MPFGTFSCNPVGLTVSLCYSLGMEQKSSSLKAVIGCEAAALRSLVGLWVPFLERWQTGGSASGWVWWRGWEKKEQKDALALLWGAGWKLVPLHGESSAEKGSTSDVCVNRKQSAKKWSRRKESGDSLGGRQRVPILHIGLVFLTYVLLMLFISVLQKIRVCSEWKMHCVWINAVLYKYSLQL